MKHSYSAGAIGILGLKKTVDGVCLYFAHNTDSFVSLFKLAPPFSRLTSNRL